MRKFALLPLLAAFAVSPAFAGSSDQAEIVLSQQSANDGSGGDSGPVPVLVPISAAALGEEVAPPAPVRAAKAEVRKRKRLNLQDLWQTGIYQ